jgi:hypothetical protein
MQYTVTQYLREHAIVDPANIAALADVIHGFRVACMRRGVVPPTRQAIVAELQAAGYKMGQAQRALGVLGVSFYPRPKYEVIEGRIIRNSPAKSAV